jgi:16S rRNA (guanine527-N7)-methyltransferase
VQHSSAGEADRICSASAISRETQDRLNLFADLLLRWNRTVNLISRRDEAQVWPRHIGDSLQLIPHISGRPERAVDLGSGGGFPGLVLAIATAIPFDLIESDQRKCAFLREAAREAGADVRVIAQRIEATKVKPAALITARALAPLPALLELATPLLGEGGKCLFLKGETADSELTAAAAKWQMRVERFPSQTGPGAAILRLSEIRRVRANP